MQDTKIVYVLDEEADFPIPVTTTHKEQGTKMQAIAWQATLTKCLACLTLESALVYIADDGWLFMEEPKIIKLGCVRYIQFHDSRPTLMQDDYEPITIYRGNYERT